MLAPPIAFQLARSQRPELPVHGSDEAIWNGVCHRVLRQPTALVEHARRIALCERRPLRRYAAASLADLLYVLDGRGRSLAMRELACVVDTLDEQHRRILGRWAAVGRSPGAARERAMMAELPGRLLPAFNPTRLRAEDAERFHASA